MARLVMPKFAVRGYPEKTTAEYKKGKWHIPAVEFFELDSDAFDDCIHSACNLIIWQSHYFDTVNIREVVLISDVPTKNLCRKCLGPIYADDCPF